MFSRLILVSFSVAFLFLTLLIGIASAETWYVDDDRGADFTSIQNAIDAAVADDTIIVKDGTYNENVDVNKSLTIRSENGANSTIVQAANSNDHVFELIAGYVNISGFMVTGATGKYPNNKAGIYLGSGIGHCNIYDNNVSSNYVGIYLDSSSNNNLVNNTAKSNNWWGIYMYSSSNNTLVNNIAKPKNRFGIYMHFSNNNSLTNNTANSSNFYGIYLRYSSDNTIMNNTANSNKRTGIELESSNNNIISYNTVSSSEFGIYLSGSNRNIISNNDVKNNREYGIFAKGDAHDNKLTDNEGIVYSITSISTPSAKTWYVDDDRGADFTRIQNAIDNANDGDTIIVFNGTYYEKLFVPKQLTLRGIDYPIVDARGYYSAITIVRGGGTLNGFKVTNSSGSTHLESGRYSFNINDIRGYFGGIWLKDVSNCNISNNIAFNNTCGINLDHSSNNILTNNTIYSNKEAGIVLLNSSNNTLTQNTFSDNGKFGIFFFESQDNSLVENIANSNGWYGMWLYYSSNNNLTYNTASKNRGCGISLTDSSNNMVYRNIALSDNNCGIYVGPGSAYNTFKMNKGGIEAFGTNLEESARPNTYISNIGNHNLPLRYGLKNVLSKYAILFEYAFLLLILIPVILAIKYLSKNKK